MKKHSILLKYRLFISIITILAGTYFLVNYLIGKESFNQLKSLISEDHKLVVKKYIFPYKYITQQKAKIANFNESGINKEYLALVKNQEKKIIIEQTMKNKYIDEIRLYNKRLINIEVNYKESLSDIPTKMSVDLISLNKQNFNKYTLVNGFYSGINLDFPGSGYIDFHQNNLLVLSSRGILAFSTDIEKNLYFKQINNNINEFINLKQFLKFKVFSLKDLLVHEDKVFISYTEEVEEDCWNTSVIFGDINYKEITFKKLFSPQECVHSQNNRDKEFEPLSSGGRIVGIDQNHILLSTGDYRSRFLAQDKNSVVGKIIKIDINTSDYEIFSMGHRNPQGLYFDKENNFILSTEHGPLGGDEINLIKMDKRNSEDIPNYGWPVSSYGEHYGGRSKKNEEKYKKYPLYKSHKDHGFIEPIKSFVPSIGISEITKINNNRYVVSSLGWYSIYFFSLTDERKVVDIEKVEIKERIRDLKYHNNKLYLFLENTASIGIIPLT
jgi:hypothetical protein